MPYPTIDWGGSYVDGWGIRKIQPTYRYSTGRPGYWHIDMRNPDVDLDNLRDVRFELKPDGTWLIWKSTSDGQIRLEAPSPDNAHFHNFEMTAYYRLEVTSASSSKNNGFIFQPYCRGGHHTSSSWLGRCDGSAYKAAVLIDPSRPSGGCQSALRKEVNHGAYCPNRFRTGTGIGNYSNSLSAARNFTSRSLFYRWIGVKFLCWNFRASNGRKYVHLELWVDNGSVGTARNWSDITRGNTSRWVRVQQTNDGGGWGSSSDYFYSRCPNLDDNYSGSYRQRSGIINRPGSNRYYRGDPYTNYASFRTDYSRYRIAFLSCREIAPRSSNTVR